MFYHKLYEYILLSVLSPRNFIPGGEKKEKEKEEKQEEGNEKEVKHSEWNKTAQMLGRKSSLFATNHSLALSNMHTLNV